jgi:tight adherence protein B
MSRQPGLDQGRPTGTGLTDGPADRATSPGNGWWKTADRLLVSIPPWRTVLLVAVLVGVAGALVGGPVGAIAAATYAGLAARGFLRRRAGVVADRVHRRQLDELCALAADLRAGLPPSVAMLPAEAPGRVVELARAAVRLAEQTGAPLADLIERIEADARAMDRGLAAAEAQAAGARATAWLLAGLPLGGIALGYGIGVDPLRILLYSPLGAACALGAIALQLAGLAWAGRLSAGDSGADRFGGTVGRAVSGLGAGATWAA